MADQTAAQVRAAQKAESEAAQQDSEPKSPASTETESKVEAAQQDSGEDRKIDQKPEMIGGVPKVRWDNEALDPTKRKSIASDPTGEENRKLLAEHESDD